MGGSENWLKLFIPRRKSNPNDQENALGAKRSKKWKLWRSSSSCSSSDQFRLSVKRGQVAASESSDSPTVDDAYTAAMATLVRAPPKDFLIIRQEWAAIRIQTAFRALLARRAFRALKALVRVQAIVRGRLVRKQAAMTLKCMQALVRAQAQVKAHRVRMSLEGESLHKKLEIQSDPPVKLEEGKWCDSRGSKEEVKTKLQMRQEAAIKKERAMAYFISQQQLRASPNLNPTKKESFSGPIKPSNKPEKSSSWSWLDGLTASKSSSESRITEELNSKKKANSTITRSSNSFEYDSTRVTTTRNNNMTRRVTARPPLQGEVSYCSSSSQPSSSTTTAFEGAEDSASSASVGLSKPRYMNLTASNRAKHREGISKSRFREIPPLAQHYVKSGLRFSGEMTRNSVDSALCSASIHSEDVNPANFRLDRYDRTRCR